MISAGERKEALISAGFTVAEVRGFETPIGYRWEYFPAEAVSSQEAQAVIESFE